MGQASLLPHDLFDTSYPVAWRQRDLAVRRFAVAVSRLPIAQIARRIALHIRADVAVEVSSRIFSAFSAYCVCPIVDCCRCVTNVRNNVEAILSTLYKIESLE